VQPVGVISFASRQLRTSFFKIRFCGVDGQRNEQETNDANQEKPVPYHAQEDRPL
jgi:hypothetical protein